jgi:heme A synthase
MSSPFKTSQEFLEVKGPLYTFANSPVWLTIFLILSVIIFLWFIYASYKIKSGSDVNSDIATMSILILTGTISVAQSIYVSGTTAVEAYLRKNNTVSTSIRTPSRITRRTNTTRQYRAGRSTWK